MRLVCWIPRRRLPRPSRRKSWRWLSIRPERVSFVDAESEASIPARIGQTVYLGTDTQAEAHLKGGMVLRARLQNALDAGSLPTAGEEIHLSVAPGAARFLVD